jgi:predicted RNA binding protein YcfA (HicA-like mRNA interferase family)
MKPKDLIKILESNGYILKRVGGSHYFFIHPINGKITVVPFYNKDLPKGTFYAILKQAGIDKENLK